MPIKLSEKRVFPRSQFFLVKAGDELLSYFSFRPENAVEATPALVVDLSDGGVQVLTANDPPLVKLVYRLELVTGERVGSGKQYEVHLIWSRPDGVNTRCGFAIEGGAAIAEEVGVLLAGSERSILRCVLYPN